MADVPRPCSGSCHRRSSALLSQAMWILSKARFAAHVCLLGVLLHVSNAAHSAPITGTYVGDASPGSAYLLILVQSGSELTGSLRAAHAGSGTVNSTTISVKGAIADGMFTLREASAGAAAVAFGRLAGDVLAVTLESGSAATITLTFRRGTTADFNKLVSYLQSVVGSAEASCRARRAGADTERRHLESLAQALTSDIVTMRLTGLHNDALTLSGALDEAQDALAKLTTSLEYVRRLAAARPMTCDQAVQVRRKYVQSMEWPWGQNFSSGILRARSAETSAKARLERSGGLLAKGEQDATALRVALSHAAPGHGVNASPADWQRPAEAYREVVNATRTQLPGWGSRAEDLLARGREVMREGGAIAKGVTPHPRCE